MPSAKVQGQKLEHEGYALGAASIVRPVHLSLFYPVSDPKNVTNLQFASLQVETKRRADALGQRLVVPKPKRESGP